MSFTYHLSWAPIIEPFLAKTDILELYEQLKPTYPPIDQAFRVFEMDVADIRIVLLGQDPYHKKGQAHGLSFSVPIGQPIPPSLRRIYQELNRTFPERNYKFTHGNLEQWMYREHIFLLNVALTVSEGSPLSHMKIWESFTDSVLAFIATRNPRCVFLLMGQVAQKKRPFGGKAVICPHPSPLAASSGFIGCNVFKALEGMVGKIDFSI